MEVGNCFAIELGKCAEWRAVLELSEQLLEIGDLRTNFWICLGFFLEARQAPLDSLDICEDELGIDDVDVVFWIDRCFVVADDVAIFKSAHYVHDGVALADIVEEFIAQSFALRRTSYQSRDVNKRDSRRDDLLRMIHIRQNLQALIRNGDDAGIWLDSCKRIICRQNIIICQGVK